MPHCPATTRLRWRPVQRIAQNVRRLRWTSATRQPLLSPPATDSNRQQPSSSYTPQHPFCQHADATLRNSAVAAISSLRRPSPRSAILAPPAVEHVQLVERCPCFTLWCNAAAAQRPSVTLRPLVFNLNTPSLTLDPALGY
ncbi:hypothetical protein BJY59DRAFT_698986 [Rhodotorula toruloides]